MKKLTVLWIVLILVLFAGSIAALIKKKKLKKEQGSTAIPEEGQKTE